MWGLGFNAKVLYIYEVAKSLGFCFGKEKIKQNKKIWLRAVAV
jgi:hypothetical protein